MILLDCTLRDGGYYTNWDFNPLLEEKYLFAMENLPITYLEVGYASFSKDSYLGKNFFTPIAWLDKIKAIDLENSLLNSKGKLFNALGL